MSSPSPEERSGTQQSAIRRNTQNSSQFSKDLNTSTPPLRSNANSPSGYTSSGNNSNFNPPASQFGQGAGNGPFNRDPPSVMSPALRSPSEVASSYFGRDDGSRSNSGDGLMPQDGRLGDGGEGERVRGGADSVGHASSGSHHRQDVQQQHQSEGQHQKSERDARDNYEGYGYGEHHQRLRERELSSVDSRGFSSMDSHGPGGWRESDTSYDSLRSRSESMAHSQRSPTSVDSQYHSAHPDSSKEGPQVEFGLSNFAPYLDNGPQQQQHHQQQQVQGYTPHYQHQQQQQQNLHQPQLQLQNPQHSNASLHQDLLHSQQQSNLPTNQPMRSSNSHPQLSVQSSSNQLLQQQQQFAHQNLPPSRPDSPEFSIFVGDLSPDLREEDLVAQFLNPPPWPPSHPFAIAHAHALQAKGHYGPPPRVAPRPFTTCKSSKIMIDPVNRSSRGFGFVRFSTEDDCNRALIEMQGVVMVPANGASPGRPLRVCTATPKNRHGSGGAPGPELQIPPGMTHSLSGTNLYSGPGRASSMSLSLPLPSPSPTLPGGYGAQSSLGARAPQHPEMLQRASPQGYHHPPPLMPLQSAPLDQGPLSAPPFGPSPSMASSVVSALPPGTGLASLAPSASSFDPSNTTVFVGGLSSLISEDTLKTFFVPFGEITYVKIPPGKGCGFVQFVRKTDAERAIERMQGFPIGGGRIRLSWGRSQGDKAAAAAVTAAQRAAQLGQLAGLAGLSGLSQTQLAQLAGLSKAINAQTVRADPNYPPQPGMGPDLNSALLRQLTAAASGLAAESAPSPPQPRSNYSEYPSQYAAGRDDLDADLDLRAAFEGLAFNSGSQSSQIPQTERFESVASYGERGRSQSHYPSLEQPRRNSPYTLVQSSKFAPFSPQDSPVGHPSNLPHEDSSRWNQYG